MNNWHEILQKAELLQKLPVGPLSPLEIEVWVLRLDLLHPVISGNKWLKLLPWLEMVNDNRLNGLVSIGGAWSNHLHAAAFACMNAGLSFTAIVKAPPGTSNSTLTDVEKWGGKLVFCPERKLETNLLGQQIARENNALFVPMGGEGARGVQGVSRFFKELSLPAFDTVYCPVGTGTTFEGIALSGLSFQKLVGINPGINDPAYAALLTKIRQLFPERQFIIERDPGLKKFGYWPDILPEKMNEWWAVYQLPTDVVYTAKMFFNWENNLLEKGIQAGEKVLLVHTGGLQGNRSLPADRLSFSKFLD